MLLPAGVPLSFAASFDSPSLHVALSIYDNSGVSPVLVYGPVAMTLLTGNTYTGKFTALSGKTYVVFMAVYTDNSFTVLNNSYPEQVSTMETQYLSPIGQNITGIVGCSSPQNVCPFSIFLGDSKTMYLQALNGSTKNPLDLTSCTEISVPLPNADGSFTILTLSSGHVAITAPAVLGQFSVPISSINSALLNTGQFQNIDVTFTISGVIFTVPFLQAFSVFEVS